MRKNITCLNTNLEDQQQALGKTGLVQYRELMTIPQVHCNTWKAEFGDAAH